jgi:pSer/pThr/pTyr-binding forkhead associated (FHA) protein
MPNGCDPTMRVRLEVVSGAPGGRVIELEPRPVIRFGRTQRAEIAFPDDAHMSAVHFTVECDAGVWRLRDSGSRNGTFLNGQRVRTARLKHGDRIVAGRTAFLVRIEDTESPEPEVQLANTGVPGAALDRLITLFHGELQPLFAVLDAARDPHILNILLESNQPFESLLNGQEGQDLAHFAPYLARLPEGSLLLETLVRQGWGNSWGVYLTSHRTLKEVQNHIRRFLRVRLPEGREVYFRYYDPRVLRLFLPTCRPDEINRFFGPVKCFMMEGDEPDILLQFVNRGHGAEKVSLPLSPYLCGAIPP